MTNSLSYVLSSLNSASIARKKNVFVPGSKANAILLNILYKNGYIAGFKPLRYKFRVFLKYSNGHPTIQSITIYSTPSRKLYSTFEKLLVSFSLNDFVILSTNSGFMSLVDAFQLKLGGQIICKIN